MNVTVNLTNEYVPKWNGNDKDSSPMIVRHRTPSMSLREELMPKPKLLMKVSTDGKSEGGKQSLSLIISALL